MSHSSDSDPCKGEHIIEVATGKCVNCGYKVPTAHSSELDDLFEFHLLGRASSSVQPETVEELKKATRQLIARERQAAVTEFLESRGHLMYNKKFLKLAAPTRNEQIAQAFERGKHMKPGNNYATEYEPKLKEYKQRRAARNEGE